MGFPYFQTAQDYFYGFIIGIVILLVGLVIGFLAKKFLYKVFQEMGLNRIVSKVGLTYDLEKTVSSIVSYTIYLFTVVVFLDQLGLRLMVLYLIAGGLLGLLILTVIVGLKDIVPNLIGRIYVQQKEAVWKGKSLQIKEISGIVERVGYLETEIKTRGGDVLYLPNSLFLKNKFRLK